MRQWEQIPGMTSVAIQAERTWETEDNPGFFVCYSLFVSVVDRHKAKGEAMEYNSTLFKLS